MNELSINRGSRLIFLHSLRSFEKKKSTVRSLARFSLQGVPACIWVELLTRVVTTFFIELFNLNFKKKYIELILYSDPH